MNLACHGFEGHGVYCHAFTRPYQHPLQVNAAIEAARGSSDPFFLSLSLSLFLLLRLPLLPSPSCNLLLLLATFSPPVQLRIHNPHPRYNPKRRLRLGLATPPTRPGVDMSMRCFADRRCSKRRSSAADSASSFKGVGEMEEGGGSRCGYNGRGGRGRRGWATLAYVQVCSSMMVWTAIVYHNTHVYKGLY